MKDQFVTTYTYWIFIDEKEKQAKREKAYKARACKPSTHHTKSGFGKINVNRKG